MLPYIKVPLQEENYSPQGRRRGWIPPVICIVPSSTVNSTMFPASHRVWVIPQVSLGNFLPSVSGEWQVTASVTNESSVQLHLFNVLLRRVNHSRLFVKLLPPLRKGTRQSERKRKLNIYRNHPSLEYCYKPLTLNIFLSAAERGAGWLYDKALLPDGPKTVTIRDSSDLCSNNCTNFIMSNLFCDLRIPGTHFNT